MSGHVLPVTNPVARKEYWCDMCTKAIEKGEKHVYCSEFYDGEFYSSRYHDWCSDLIPKLTADWMDDDFETCSVSVAFDEWIHDRYCEWGIDEEMHVLSLLDQLAKWQVHGDDRRAEMTCRAIQAQLEDYTGNLIDREEILKEVRDANLWVYDNSFSSEPRQARLTESRSGGRDNRTLTSRLREG